MHATPGDVQVWVDGWLTGEKRASENSVRPSRAEWLEDRGTGILSYTQSNH
jgi:hypothetical protein